uniref:AB hydrolase-1 domain-containing protein n=1 Tax=Opuntia streptacantha TaxID=393608 RepID=A0A7C8YL29_OPUST
MVMLAAVGVVAPPIAGNSPLSTQLKPLNTSAKRRVSTVFAQDGFPSFLPKQIHSIKDPFARNLAVRIERLPVTMTSSDSCVMSSCIRPSIQGKTDPVVLLHGFDSSCLEWRCTFPLLEKGGAECWALDILGWGFSDLGMMLLLR